MKVKIDCVKILSTVATVISFGVTLLSNWTAEKEMDAMVEKKVNEALKKKEKES